MRFVHIITLFIFGLAYLFTQEIARSVDIAASWGFWISIIVFAFVMLWPILITSGGAIGGGSAGGSSGGSVGGILGALLGVFGGGLLSILLFITPIVFVLLSCLGYYFLGEWGASGLEDKASCIVGLIFLGFSLVVSLLKRG